MDDRGEVSCHLCFNDKVLRDWIKAESIGREVPLVRTPRASDLLNSIV
jgi:hypothetical protein